MNKKSLLTISFVCVSFWLSAQVENLESHFNKPFYKDVLVGFSLYDIAAQKVVFQHNANQYFTPASNTKIVTLRYFIENDLYKDSIASIQYTTYKNKIYVKGLGDPTMFHSKFGSNKVLDFLKKQRKKIVLVYSRDSFPYKDGWSIDDAKKGWLTEVNSFPMFENEVKIENGKAFPTYFQNNIHTTTFSGRNIAENTFYTDSPNNEFAYITDSKTVENVLEQAIGKNITVLSDSDFDFSKIPANDIHTIKSYPYEPVLKNMMKTSNNFLANQLNYIAESKGYSLSDFKQFRLTDGSGLSRYNLISPSNLIEILLNMYQKVPFGELKDYFAINGQFGSLEKVLPNEKPFLYAKTGTLSNNHTLSGYIVCDSGKVFAFSFMNNHYLKPIEEIRTEMYNALLFVKKNY